MAPVKSVIQDLVNGGWVLLRKWFAFTLLLSEQYHIIHASTIVYVQTFNLRQFSVSYPSLRPGFEALYTVLIYFSGFFVLWCMKNVKRVMQGFKSKRKHVLLGHVKGCYQGFTNLRDIWFAYTTISGVKQNPYLRPTLNSSKQLQVPLAYCVSRNDNELVMGAVSLEKTKFTLFGRRGKENSGI